MEQTDRNRARSTNLQQTRDAIGTEPTRRMDDCEALQTIVSRRHPNLVPKATPNFNQTRRTTGFFSRVAKQRARTGRKIGVRTKPQTASSAIKTRASFPQPLFIFRFLPWSKRKPGELTASDGRSKADRGACSPP